MLSSSTILACSFTVGVRILWKSCVGKGAWQQTCHLVPPTLCILSGGWIWVNYHKNPFLQILRSYFTPYKHCDFTGTVLWYYHRPWVTCVLECHKNNLHNCVCLEILIYKTYFSWPITTSKSLHKDFRTALLVGVPFSLPENNNRNND